MGFMGIGSDDSSALNALKQNTDIWGNIVTPDLKWQNYDPTTFNPDAEQATTIKEDPQLISRQMDALNNLAGLSQNGLSEVDQAGYQKARSEAGQIANQQTGAALENAQARGQSGSGLEFAMREMAGQNASNAAQNSDLQQAADAAKQRALYQQAYGSQLAGQRAQDFQTQGANTNILNQFNQQNTQARNQANYANTQQMNDAQKYNQQGTMNTQQQVFNNAVTRAGGQAAANTGLAQGYAAQDAANTSQQNALIGTAANIYTGGMYGAASGAMKKSGSGGQQNSGSNFAHGGVIPGIPKVPGDSVLNDTMPINASPGEIMIPRSHAQTPHLAKAYIEHLFGKR